MASPELCWLPATELAALIRRKRVLPVEVVDAVLDRIGQPAASVPSGVTASGLPIGLQIVGRRFDDLSVLRASAAFERLRPWAQRRPPAA